MIGESLLVLFCCRVFGSFSLRKVWWVDFWRSFRVVYQPRADFAPKMRFFRCVSIWNMLQPSYEVVALVLVVFQPIYRYGVALMTRYKCNHVVPT